MTAAVSDADADPAGLRWMGLGCMSLRPSLVRYCHIDRARHPYRHTRLIQCTYTNELMDLSTTLQKLEVQCSLSQQNQHTLCHIVCPPTARVYRVSFIGDAILYRSNRSACSATATAGAGAGASSGTLKPPTAPAPPKPAKESYTGTGAGAAVVVVGLGPARGSTVLCIVVSSGTSRYTPPQKSRILVEERPGGEYQLLLQSTTSEVWIGVGAGGGRGGACKRRINVYLL